MRLTIWRRLLRGTDRSGANGLLALAVAGLCVLPVYAQSRGDMDGDGIPDVLERQLLARFTPMLHFTNDGGEEQYRPMDAWQYVKWSELQTDGDEGKGVIIKNADLFQNPLHLLEAGTDVTKEVRFRSSDRFLNPLADVPKSDGNWARHGWAWNDVLDRKNVGLYGHVVPFVAKSPQTDFLQCPQSGTPSSSNRDEVLCSIDGNRSPPGRYYKVEYWQFFGYNGVGKPFDIGDHEGDWTTVQLLVDATSLQIVQVHHFFHGHIAAYDLRKYPNSVAIEGGRVREYRGANWPKDVRLTWYDGPVAASQNAEADRNAQNNVVRLMADSVTHEFTHPVVYVEHGGHEFWPTDAWGYQDAPSHSGNDTRHSYLAAPPPNLGEVEHPLNDVPEDKLVLLYNGHWGAYSKKNSPPQGPPLHSSWTWPASSSVRWKLPKDLGN